MPVRFCDTTVDLTQDTRILRYSPVKIILKTKDEKWHLRSWFEYHSALFGEENIIIFDNGSVDEDVIGFYEEIKESVEIYIYNKNTVDSIHKSNVFNNLYKTIGLFCDYFCFLDTDERLVFFDRELKICSRDEFIGCIKDGFGEEAAFLPTLWLQNAFRSSDSFVMRSELDFQHAVKWGKPLVKASRTPDGFINHNCQIAEISKPADIVAPCAVLHLKNLYPEQRIAANIKKLYAFGLIEENLPIEDVVKIVFPAQGNARIWQDEIRSSIAKINEPEERGEVSLENERLVFSSEGAAKLLGSWCDDPSIWLRKCGLIK